MEQVVEVSKNIWYALKTADAEILRKWVHSDAVFVHMGITLTRDVEIEVVKSGGIVYKDVIFEEQTIQNFDTVIILLNKVKVTAIVNGNEVINPFVVTEVYRLEESEPKLLSFSYTRINY